MGPAGRIVTIRRSGADGPPFPLSRSACLFGRAIECDIRIQLPVVSKQHCKIEISEQEVTLINFSSTNPTQVNGSAIDGAVQLRHGDVITIVDRSFRYEDESRQDESSLAGLPGQRREQESTRRVSRSGCSSDSGGSFQEPDAPSSLTEGSVPGRPLVRGKSVEDAGPAPEGSELPRGHGGPAASAPARAEASVPPGSCGAGVGTPAQRPARRSKSASPFRRLYESMKEELDVKSEKENVLQERRKSGAHRLCTEAPESAGGLQAEVQAPAPLKSRRKSGQSSQVKADPAGGEGGSSQAGEQRAQEGSGQHLGVAASPACPRPGTPGTPHSQQNSSRKRRREDPAGLAAAASESQGQSPGLGAEEGAFTPWTFLPGGQTPAKGARAESSQPTPDALSKRRQSSPARIAGLGPDPGTPRPAVLAPLPVQLERRVQKDPLQQPEKLGPPGLSPASLSDVADPISRMEGAALKRRRVSFGGRLRPELFDENLPPNTPLKRGETPVRRRSLAPHTPAVLKKIIKEQPQLHAREAASEMHLEPASPAAQNAGEASPVTRGPRRQSVEAAIAPGEGRSPHATHTPKSRRRSSGLSSRRASLGRGRQGVLQMICSRRRSGASEANLLVAKSWADVVKLGAKQTQVRAAKPPQRQVHKKPRKAHTPKKPAAGGMHLPQFSTGHANSPCTITIGRAQLQRVSGPARPHRVLSHLVFSRRADFSEDLSGLTEMFKTPAREKPQAARSGPDSKDLLGETFQEPNAGGKSLMRAAGDSEESLFLSAQDAATRPSDSFASPVLRRQCTKAREDDTVTTRRSICKMAGVGISPRWETKPLEAASGSSKARRSAELGAVQMAAAECGPGDANPPGAEHTWGTPQRKTPRQEQKLDGEVKAGERSFETCKKSIKLEESSEATTAVRSGRTSELPWGGTDVTGLQRPHQAEPKQTLASPQSHLQTLGPAEGPMVSRDRTTQMPCKSAKPEPMGTPSSTNRRLRTPLGKEDQLPALRKPLGTPGGTTLARGMQAGGDQEAGLWQETPAQNLGSAEDVKRSKRRPSTPRAKAQPSEDLAGLTELFRTPGPTQAPVAGDRARTLCESPEPEPVSTPRNRRRLSKTPLGKVAPKGEPSTLRKSMGTPGAEHAHPEPVGHDEATPSSQETPQHILDSAEDVTGGNRQPSTPRAKAQPSEDLAGLTELFRTPVRAQAPVINNRTTQMPCRSPKTERVDTPRRLRTPLGKVDQLPALRTPSGMPGGTARTHQGAVGHDEGTPLFQETPQQILDSAEVITGGKRRPSTPRAKAQSSEDLAGLTELFRTPGPAQAPVAGDRARTLCESPEPEPVSTPRNKRRLSKTPLGKVALEEEPTALRKSMGTPGGRARSHPKPVGHDEGTPSSQETPQYVLDSAEDVTGSKRRPRTPKAKAQPSEDLAGLTELFRTPGPAQEPVINDRTTQMPCKSAKPEPVGTPSSTNRQLRTPLGKEDQLPALRKPSGTPGGTTLARGMQAGGDQEAGLWQETPAQNLGSAEDVKRSKRRPSTPRAKAQPSEDLAGLTELFRTPGPAQAPVAGDRARTLCESPEREPVSTPRNKRRLSKTPLGKVALKGEPSTLRKSMGTPGGRARSHSELVGDEEDPPSSQETPQHILDSAEDVTGGNRQPSTPRAKAQPSEDLAGLTELFRTPVRAQAPVINNRTTQMPCRSPKTERVDTPRRLRTPLGKVDRLPALRTPSGMPGGTARTHQGAVGHDEGTPLFQETPQQMLDSEEVITGGKRRPSTPRAKAQPLEDLTGLTELFRTPGPAQKPTSSDRATQVRCMSPKAEPVNMPTGGKRQLKTTPWEVDGHPALGHPTGTPGAKQKLDLAEDKIGSKRAPRTPKAKAQVSEDLAGLTELFRTPGPAQVPVAGDRARTLCESPEPEPVSTPRNKRRLSKTPLGKVAPEEEPTTLRKSMGTPGGRARSYPEPVGHDEGTPSSQETPQYVLDLAEDVTGNKRRPRTPKAKTQPSEDLAGLTELFRTPGPTQEPVINDRTTQMPCKSAKPEPVGTPSSTNRQLRTPLGKEDQLPALRKPSGTPGGTTLARGMQAGGDQEAGLWRETPAQNLGSAEDVKRSKRRPSTPRAKAQPSEDLAGLTELFRTPGPTQAPVAGVRARTLCESPEPEPVSTPRNKRRLSKTPLGKVALEEEPTALRKSMGTPGGRAHSHPESVGHDEATLSSQETPQHIEDLAEDVTGSKRRPRTPKAKAQPSEDLAGLTELFRTPGPAQEPVINDRTTQMPCKSAKPEPVGTPSSTDGRLRTPLGKEDQLPALRKPSGTPGGATLAQGMQAGGDQEAGLWQETPAQNLGSAEDVKSSKRRPSTPRAKAQPSEDLAGLTELFRTPDRAQAPVVGDRAAQIPRTSAEPEPVVMPTSKRRRLGAPPRSAGVEGEPPAPRKSTRTVRKTTRGHQEPLGNDERIKLSQETAEQKPDKAENLTGGKRQPRAARAKAQPSEDLARSMELSQPPRRARDAGATVRTTQIPRTSPLPEPAVPAARPRRLRAPPETEGVEEEHHASRKPTRAATAARRTQREPGEGDENMAPPKETVQQKQGAEGTVVGGQKPLRSSRRKAQAPGGSADSTELFQEPVAVDRVPEMPCKSLPAEPSMPASKKGRARAPPAEEHVQMAPPAPRKSSRMAGRGTHTPSEPEGTGTGLAPARVASMQEVDCVESVTGSKRQPRASKAKTRPLAATATGKEGLQELGQAQALGSTGEEVSKTPQQMPDVGIPRRALRAPKGPPREELARTRNSGNSQRGGLPSLAPQEDGRAVGRLAGTKRLRSGTPPPGAMGEKPDPKKRRTAPREADEPPQPPAAKKSQRTVGKRTAPAQDPPSVETQTAGPRGGHAAPSADKGRSLRARRPDKTDAEGRSPECLTPAEKVTLKRNEKRPVKTAPETEPRHVVGAATARGKARGSPRSLRSGRRNEKPLPGAAEDSAGEVRKEEAAVAKPAPGSLRPRRPASNAAGPARQREPPPRATRGTKTGAAEATEKGRNVSARKMRTRSCRDHRDV
ncbi:LOW QUALITY PROTEIN: proliferation marker protein Ki-67 [Talpa occidentalis]|uniref:LOW QUALITY PROTEIN: proliferation marker protein Ki-67 n=1 Tax=Talpa occidentalis TaxID=50954 RepID=UPI0023F8A890|nr:LOW QUALITY PROTEIN: proliferation marker protein Ki-67 [Talpa occidentalis]